MRQDRARRRCIVVASHGSLELLKDYVQLAKSDYRDAIMSGEYDSAQRQVRDLRVSFLLDSPETFWLGEVACMMALRDYALASVDSRRDCDTVRLHRGSERGACQVHRPGG